MIVCMREVVYLARGEGVVVMCGKEGGPATLGTEPGSVEEHKSCNTIWGFSNAQTRQSAGISMALNSSLEAIPSTAKAS